MSDVDILARTIWGEARGEGSSGMTAVANVIMNRVRHPRWWGHDIENVCRTPYQFSAWNPGDPNLSKLLCVSIEDPQFLEATKIAGDAVGGLLADNTCGATSYYDASMIDNPPHWAIGRQPCARIGRLLLYRDT